MQFRGVEIVCPACRAELAREGDDLGCAGCGRRFPILLGIPDLRVRDDPYISIERDRAKGLKLAELTEGLSFEDALAQYYATTPEVPPAQARLFQRSVLAAESRARERLDLWDAAPGGALVEIGCGTGPLLLAARGRYGARTGIDIAFRWLVIGRVRLKQAGDAEAVLICACAEALPFPDRAFDRVVADSTLENVHDAEATLLECQRVLREHGRIFIATPNRWSPGPDPHTGLPAGAWLPERVTAAWVRSRGGIPPQRKFFTHRSLARALHSAGFADVGVTPPDIPASQRDALGPLGRTLVNAYHAAKRVPFMRAVLLRIGPLLEAVATRAPGRSHG